MVTFLLLLILLILVAGLYASHIGIRAAFKAGVDEVKAEFGKLKAKIEKKP